MHAHYVKNHVLLLNWAELTEVKQLENPEDTYWSELGQKLKVLNPNIASMLVAILLDKPPYYDDVKRWFASRFEYNGMSVLTMLIDIHKHLSVRDLVISLAGGPTEIVYSNILASYLIYVCGITELKLTDTLVGTVSLGQDDVMTGRFARLFSNQYCSWATYYSNAEVTHQLSGAAKALCPTANVPESVTKTPQYDMGYRMATLLRFYRMSNSSTSNPIARAVARDMITSYTGPAPAETHAATHVAANRETTEFKSALDKLSSGL